MWLMCSASMGKVSGSVIRAFSHDLTALAETCFLFWLVDIKTFGRMKT